jgi:GNAT superfamily N-acetyltransferase
MVSFGDFWTVYADSFPSDERRSFDQQMALIEEESYSVIDIFHGGCYAGFIACWDLESFIFIEHFAIRKELRGMGIGQAFLWEFLEDVPVPVVLEVELPRGESEARRISFYERLGFSYSGFTYMQPPYVRGGNYVPLSLMTYPKPFDFDELSAAKDTIFTRIYDSGSHISTLSSE